MDVEKRGRWSNRLGFLLAAIGSAVGLGNIWRFPYVAHKNGGGAFLLPYAIALFVVGVPLLIAEQGLGSHFRGAAPLVFSRIKKSCEWIGWWPALVAMFAIMFYYVVVLGWCVNYLAFSINLGWGADTESFFNSFLGLTSGPFDLGGIQLKILIGTFIVWALVWGISVRGVSGGLELANRICIPLLAFLMAVMMVWMLMLPGSSEGIAVFLKPDVSRLSDPVVWSDAFSQVFFSLSVAMGIMFAYSSYLGPKAAIVDNSWITAIADTSFAVFAGLVVFSTLGTMARVSGVPVESVVKGGPGLAFVTYPKAISMLPFGSQVFGAFFFLSLIFAGITSAISILEAFVCAVLDKFKASRTRVVTLSCVVGFAGSMIFTCGGGLYWLDILDYFVMNFGLLAIGLLEALVIGWIFGSEKLSRHVNEGSSWKVGRLWGLCLKYAIPIVLLILLIGGIADNAEKPYGGYSWLALSTIGIGWLFIVIVASVLFAKSRWREISSFVDRVNRFC